MEREKAMCSALQPQRQSQPLPAWFHVGRCLARILDAFCFPLTLHRDVKKNSLTTTTTNEELRFLYVCVHTCYCACSMWKPEANAGRPPRCLSALLLRQVPSLNLGPTDLAEPPGLQLQGTSCPSLPHGVITGSHFWAWVYRGSGLSSGSPACVASILQD